ncbi:MAG: hypothetical protein AUJ20_09745 [Comamonadaceae bacterium CG1_02_60_18]|nr:MAG: hypothetical protein AUJ20_09745 [Comamonadaceae bacterium CG1_02_60_18]PIQ56444.1 MAG: hypothetical protein COW02_01060 [Comamonadaceae bacterium CG12_big_fil_rev_8_21_14_0_65_59_15]
MHQLASADGSMAHLQDITIQHLITIAQIQHVTQQPGSNFVALIQPMQRRADQSEQHVVQIGSGTDVFLKQRTHTLDNRRHIQDIVNQVSLGTPQTGNAARPLQGLNRITICLIDLAISSFQSLGSCERRRECQTNLWLLRHCGEELPQMGIHDLARSSV